MHKIQNEIEKLRNLGGYQQEECLNCINCPFGKNHIKNINCTCG